jgi:hypothetical protein
MSVRVASLLVVPLALAALTACDGSNTKGHPPTRTTAPTFPLSSAANIDCPKFAQLSQRITAAQTKIYTPGGSQDDSALRALQADLTGLKDKAPSDVDAAIDDMISAFRTASALLASPTPSSAAGEQLSKLGPRLSADSQKITAYVAKACK